MQTRRPQAILIGSLVLAAALVGCRRESGRSPGPAPKPGRVARLVFIDLEKSCPCTEKRVASSWKALATVLGKPPSIPLDRFHLDTQSAQAEPFLDKRPIAAAPGLYLLDGSGKIIDLLQGEISVAQIRRVIQ